MGQAASFRVPPARRSSERFEVFGGLRRKVPLKYVRQVIIINVGTDWYCFAYCHVEDRTENMKISKHRNVSMLLNVVQFFSNEF